MTSKLLYIISLPSLTPCYAKVGTAACMMKESVQAIGQQQGAGRCWSASRGWGLCSTCSSSSVMFSPSSLATRFRFLKLILPVSSSSNSLKACGCKQKHGLRTDLDYRLGRAALHSTILPTAVHEDATAWDAAGSSCSTGPTASAGTGQQMHGHAGEQTAQ